MYVQVLNCVHVTLRKMAEFEGILWCHFQHLRANIFIDFLFVIFFDFLQSDHRRPNSVCSSIQRSVASGSVLFYTYIKIHKVGN